MWEISDAILTLWRKRDILCVCYLSNLIKKVGDMNDCCTVEDCESQGSI